MKTQNQELQQNPDKSFVLKVVLAKADIAADYDRVLKLAQKDFETKGFRKGSAPLDVVKANVSETRIFEEILSHLLSHVYADKVTEYKLKPIVEPQINIVNPPLTLDKDWEVEIKSSELPVIKIDPKYTEEVKKINGGTEEENQKLSKIIDSLIKNSSADIPQMLIDHDVQKHLSDLVDQVRGAGLNIADYLKSRNETQESYVAKVQKQVSDEWKLNLAISQIAVDQKLEVKKEEVEETVKKQPELSKNLNLVYYLLTQQKVLDYLKKL